VSGATVAYLTQLWRRRYNICGMPHLWDAVSLCGPTPRKSIDERCILMWAGPKVIKINSNKLAYFMLSIPITILW